MVDDEGDDLEVETATEAQGLVSCPPLLCNSPTIDSVNFHELSWGQANDEGFVLAGFESGGVMHEVRVSAGKLKYRSGWFWFGGASLVGAGKALIVKRYGVTYRLRILAVTTNAYYNAPGTYESYRVYWTEIGGDQREQNVCPNPPSRDNTQESLGMNVLDMVMWEGDRIDEDRYEFKATAEPGAPTSDASATKWFNIGCAGQILAKMHAAHYSYASKNQPAPYTTTWAERQAFMKMMAGEYCGNGMSWTVQGTPLGWKDARGWFGIPAAYMPATIEARWTEKGASCLEEPRLQNDVNAFFPPDIFGEIKAVCEPIGMMPPACSSMAAGTDINNFDGNYLLSANPP